MRFKNYLIGNATKLLNVLALALVIKTANNTCIWVSYQPEFPKEANKYKRL